jgi:Glycosyl transferases group 1
MHLAVLAPRDTPGAFYRAMLPLRAMELLGHRVTWFGDVGQLETCDLLYVYRGCEPWTLAAMEHFRRRGAAICWDNDDDLSVIPHESPVYEQFSGARGAEHAAATRTALQGADLVTTPSGELAERFQRAGAARVSVIENNLPPEFLEYGQRRHEGVVIGWTAALDHDADVAALRVDALLRRVLDVHRDVRVVTIGVDLRLGGARYAHHAPLDLMKLLDYVGEYDIGIAPLADIAFNRARSNIKLKEYAACGVPWLASPVGPYADLGEEEGGRLVADDGWFEAIDRLVRRRRERARLGRRAKAWAKTQTILQAAASWERAFAETIELVRERNGQAGGAQADPGGATPAGPRRQARA